MRDAIKRCEEDKSTKFYEDKQTEAKERKTYNLQQWAIFPGCAWLIKKKPLLPGMLLDIQGHLDHWRNSVCYVAITAREQLLFQGDYCCTT